MLGSVFQMDRQMLSMPWLRHWMTRGDCTTACQAMGGDRTAEGAHGFALQCRIDRRRRILVESDAGSELDAVRAGAMSALNTLANYAWDKISLRVETLLVQLSETP